MCDPIELVSNGADLSGLLPCRGFIHQPRVAKLPWDVMGPVDDPHSLKGNHNPVLRIPFRESALVGVLVSQGSYATLG